MVCAQPGYEACTGCSLCLLACPVWRATRDIRLTPHGRARALQCGATADELVASIDACTFCGACEPACPQDIGLVAMMVGLRAELARHAPARVAQVRNRLEQAVEAGATVPPALRAATLLVPDKALHADSALLERMAGLLGASGRIAVTQDDGADIAQALESGAPIPDARLARFLGPLRRAGRLIVGDGMLIRALRGWLPGARIESLGVAASSTAAVRARLRATDLYVIEPRAYHADQERLVKYYDALRASLGCSMNLDLQRLAIPTTAGSLPAQLGRSRVDVRDQARWILEGREFGRVVVEDLNEIALFAAVTDKPVVHLAQLI